MGNIVLDKYITIVEEDLDEDVFPEAVDLYGD